MNDQQRKWIPNLELEDAQIKWAFSHFDGRADTYNAEGDHNFVVILPPASVPELIEQGWTIKEYEPFEEGDDPEFTMKVKISYKFEDPRIFLIKGDRKFQATKSDLKNIKRATVERMDIIVKPSRWVRPDSTGVTGYVEEMYIKMKHSRFDAMYADLHEVREEEPAREAPSYDEEPAY